MQHQSVIKIKKHKTKMFLLYLGPVGAGEGGGVGGICQDPRRGGPQVTAVRLRGSAEVTPTGVGIRAAGHPRDQQHVRASGGGDRKGVPPSTV